MAKIAKRIAKTREGIDPNKSYALPEALKLLKERSSV
ncbi:MAG: 50S ribosomal protein L1, partial [Mesorhizobium sp.]